MHEPNCFPSDFVPNLTAQINHYCAIDHPSVAPRRWESILAAAYNGKALNKNKPEDIVVSNVGYSIKSRCISKRNILNPNLVMDIYQQRFPNFSLKEMRKIKDSSSDSGKFLIDVLNERRRRVLEKYGEFRSCEIFYTRLCKNVIVRVSEWIIPKFELSEFQWEWIAKNKGTNLHGDSAKFHIRYQESQGQIAFTNKLLDQPLLFEISLKKTLTVEETQKITQPTVKMLSPSCPTKNKNIKDARKYIVFDD